MTITTTYTVTTEAALNAAIAAINLGGSSSAPNTAYAIQITASFTLTTNITAINLAAGDGLTISGNKLLTGGPADVINGNGTRRGFVVEAGSVVLDSLALHGMSATGGKGGDGALPGGGAAGLGGAVFVAAGASVALSNTSIASARAVGGRGGLLLSTGSGAGGSSGLPGGFGDGGDGGVAGGFGGGGGGGAAGGFGAGGNGGGGLAAGADIFVQTGGVLTVSGGSLAAGALTAGASSKGGSGSAYGSGIFIQGNNSIALGNVTVTGVIADQSGSGGSGANAGTGTLLTNGTTTLAATNTYTGGTQIQAGTLSLQAPGAAGSGAITFAAPAEGLIVGNQDVPTNTIIGFGFGDTIDLQGIGLATGSTISAGNQLVVQGGSSGPVTLNFDPTASYADNAFVLQSDGGTGTKVTVTQSHFYVANESDLNTALSQIDVGGKYVAPNVAYTITLTASFSLATDLDAINLGSGDTLTIDGAGNAIDGAGRYRGFFDYAGGLTLKNLTIQNAVATGGAGGSGALPGGGGAGLGGGLFVASGGAATLSNVTFVNDQAAGGAAGIAGGIGVGGGGGLGGAGGAGGARSGGGGGIGLAATGGSTTGAIAGGAGIVRGAAGGNSGTGNQPLGGAGGAFGGGGGAAGTIVTSGSGRGGGGSRSYPAAAGAGGVGGSFGGGAGAGELAGFGGGGAGFGNAHNGSPGSANGGFGGGAAAGGSGGFGGGQSAGGAGGGLGAGGDVFVQQGGSLTIAGGSLSGGGVSGGAGSGGGGSGAAFGSGIFVQGAGALSFAPAAGQTLNIGDVIADGAGSGGAGAASLTLNGAGTVVLSATNTYSGGSTLTGGTLSLQAPGAAGAGAITFAYGAAATLIIGAGDIPANIVSGFLPGDVIDLQGIGAATSAVLGAGDILTISGGTSSVQLALDPAQNFTGESFLTVSDHNGGTLLTAANVGNDFPPSISGTGTVTGNDHAPLSPLAGVTVSDLDPGQTETVTVTLSSPLNGTLSNLSGGAYDAVNGIYTVTGNAAAVTAALDALVFTPTAYQVAPGQTVTTVFNLLATDGLMFSSAAATTVNITALNDPPAISGVGGALVEGYWNVPLNPFTAGAIADPDAGATESVTFTLGQFPYGATDSSGTLSLSLPGFTLTHTGAGTYALSAGTPAAVTQAIQALQFTALPNPAVPGYTITYVTMSVSDGIAPPVTAAAEVLTGLPIFSGVTTNQSVVDGQSISPFSSVAVTDSAGLTIQGMSITLFDSSSNYLNPTDANGTLSGANLVKTGVGSYTLTPGSTASVTAELDALVFTPTLSNATVTTYFNLSAFDGATTANNGNTSVIALPGPSLPVIAGTVAGQSVADNTTIAPFATVAVTDANPTPADSATITLIDVATGTTSDANGRLSGAGLTETAPGVYQLAATDPASLTAELDAIIFTPTPYQVPAGQTVTTEFLLAVADGALASSNGSTSVVVTATSANRAWQGPGIANPSGDWNVAANWNPAAVPFSASIASINVAGTYAVTSNQTNTVAGLVIGDAGATLVINGGLFTLLGSSSNAGAIAIGDAAALQLTGTMTNSGTITLASAGAATGLVIAGSASLKGAGSVAMTDAAGNAILSNGAAATLTNASTIAGSGAIGDANLKLINAAGGVIDATGGANALTVNTGSNAVKNSGTLEATNGGDLIVAGAVANNGTLLEQGGVLKIGGALSGTGQATIAGGTLELGAGVVATQTVTFAAGAAGTLKLDRAQSFAGTVAGLAAGDAIDLANFQFSKTPTIAGVTGTGAAGSTTVVTVVDGTLTEKLTLLNQFANQFAVSPSAYTLAADSNPLSHGTLFRLAAPAP